MDIILWVVGILLAIEALDFLAHITMTSHQHHVPNSASYSGVDVTGVLPAGCAGVKDSGVAQGVEEDFELIHNSSRGSPHETATAGSSAALAALAGVADANSASAGLAGSRSSGSLGAGRDSAFAASLSLNDFNSPAKGPSGAYSNTPAQFSSGSSILSNYMNNRKYGRGSIGMLLLGGYYISQVFSEVYWRLYFCSFGRRPRMQESAAFDGSSVLGGNTSKKGRKLVAHTV